MYDSSGIVICCLLLFMKETNSCLFTVLLLSKQAGHMGAYTGNFWDIAVKRS